MTGSLAVGTALVGAVAADLGRNRYVDRRSSQDPTFHVAKNPDSDRTLLLAGGCQSHGDLLHQLLAPKLLPYGNVVTVEYPKTSFSADKIAHGLARTLTGEGLRNITSLGLSMGGMVNAHFAKYMKENNTPEQIEKHFGTFDLAIMDGSPNSWESISEEQRHQLNVAQKVRLSNSANAYKRYRMQEELGKPIIAEHEADMPLLEEMRAAKVATRLGALASQGQFMCTFHMEPGELEGFYSSTYLLYAPEDPVILPHISVPGWQAIIGESATPLQDPARPADSHAFTPYQPSFTLDLLAANQLQAA